LTPKASKTRIVHLRQGGEGFDFLGFHHRWVQARSARSRHVQFLARWPSDKAMQICRSRIRELTDRRRLLLPVEQVAQGLNRVLRGWAEYFRYGNSAERFDKIHNYATMRLARVISKRHRRSLSYGWSVVLFQSPNQCGLLRLDGIVVAPRPGRDWRAKPNAAGERRR
jgi:RNA-directed DNA polymerase